MSLHNKKIGILGENIAKKYVLEKGFHIIQSNFHTQWAEIDIIAKKNNKVVFVEVKTRIGIKKGKPYEAVTRSKYHHLKRAITYFLLQNSYKDCKLSLDVVSIILKPNLDVEKFDYFENVEI